MNPRSDPRCALQVSRYHTWPRIREQSVGEHSAQVMRILLALWPQAPRHLLVHCLIHDIGEAVSGDPPFPVKRDNPNLKAECDRIEREAHLEMCLPWSLPAPVLLLHSEALVFKVAEYLEMYEWGMYEMRLGNQYGKRVRDRCLVAARALLVDPEMPGWVKREMEIYIYKRERENGSHEISKTRDGERFARSDCQGEHVSG